MTSALRTCRGLFCLILTGCGLFIETREPAQGGADGGVDAESPPECTADPDCDDRLFCTGAERCEDGRCRSGDDACSDDGHACTVDECDEDEDRCKFDPHHELCGPGELCTSDGCMLGRSCAEDEECRDAFACNGAESCVEGRCIPGTPVRCGGVCLACDNTSGECEPNDRLCDDDLDACNGGGTCAGDGRCTPTPAVACAMPGDGTCLGCNPATGRCELPMDALCEDGFGCTMDVCSPTGVCLTTVDPAACDDGIDCTHDECASMGSVGDPLTGCRHVPMDTLCPDAGAITGCLGYFCAPGHPAADASGCLRQYDPARCPAAEPYCDEVGNCTARRCSAGCDDLNPCDGVYRCNMLSLACELVSDIGCPDPDEGGCALPFCDLSGAAAVCGSYTPPGCVP